MSSKVETYIAESLAASGIAGIESDTARMPCPDLWPAAIQAAADWAALAPYEAPLDWRAVKKFIAKVEDDHRSTSMLRLGAHTARCTPNIEAITHLTRRRRIRPNRP